MAQDYEYNADRGTLRLTLWGKPYGPSIEDYEECMSYVIKSVLEVKEVSSIVLAKDREYEYGPEQTRLLVEVASLIGEIVKSRLIFEIGKPKTIKEKETIKLCESFYPEWISKLRSIVDLINRDPIGAYVETIREVRRASVSAKTVPQRLQACYKTFYIERTLDVIKEKFEKTELIKKVKELSDLAGYHIGDRSLYRQIFLPSTRPNFMYTRFMIAPPENGISIERYTIGKTEDNPEGAAEVEIFKIPGEAQYLYHVTPPEFKLPEKHYLILDSARRRMLTERPKAVEFVRTEERKFTYNISEDLIRSIADSQKVSLTTNELQKLATILTRYTAGLGILEVLLKDPRIQDIYINGPVDRLPILLLHDSAQECRTNLIPTREDAEGWATRLRSYSGRPLDESNPVLDTEMTLPDARARFAVITRTLSPEGLSFAIRRHRDKTWTLPLFVQEDKSTKKIRMLDPLAAGLLSFLFDNAASTLIAGGRSSGKTSLLSALMLEILPKVRVITLEDSVAGDTDIVYQNDGEFKTNTVGGLIDTMIEKYGRTNEFGRDILDSNPKNVKVFAMDKEGKVALAPVSRFIRHKVNKQMFEVETATGRKIKVTEDHSLFGLDAEGNLSSVKAKNLKLGDFITTPRILPFNEKPTESINLLNHLDKLENLFITGFGDRLIKYKAKIKEEGKKSGYSKGAIYNWLRKGIIPVKVFRKLSIEGLNTDSMNLKGGTWSNPMPAAIKLDADLLKFIGLWLADGCYDKCSTIISVGAQEEKALVKTIAARFGLETKTHSDKFSLVLNSSVLKQILSDVLGLKGNAYTKQIPPWVFRLSKTQIAHVLKGLFSGDGCASDREVKISLCSEQLLKDIQTLLLGFGVIFRINSFRESDKTRPGNISALKSLKLYKENIGFLQEYKNERLAILCSKKSTHDSTDVIPLSPEIKFRLSKAVKGFNKSDYLKRANNIGREKLKTMIEEIPETEAALKQKLRNLAYSDIFWDRIKSVTPYRKEEYVYDFSVPGYENFICNNIMAHNTLELPTKQMRDLGYNIESMKSRSVITTVETEIPADIALRTALRLGESALVVGEIRSLEAKVLWEAMRIGALSNVVAGTIHGESPYGVYDRVVHDLGVPPTSFKATDIVVICRKQRLASGMASERKVVAITEVRKKWTDDPMKEGGFVDLMTYSVKEDALKPTDTLINGESEVLNRIMNSVKDFKGEWKNVWANINMRAKMIKTMVETSSKIDKDPRNPDHLEADWIIKANSQFHMIMQEVKEEAGELDHELVYSKWLNWYKKEVKG